MNKDGEIVFTDQRADTFAEHLETIQWRVRRLHFDLEVLPEEPRSSRSRSRLIAAIARRRAIVFPEEPRSHAHAARQSQRSDWLSQIYAEGVHEFCQEVD